MEGRDVLPNIHHGLRGMLQDTEPVLDVSHDLAIILLVLLEELGILFHLVVHLACERLDLVLQGRIEIMKFLLELEERLEGLIVGSGPFEQTLENPGTAAKPQKDAATVMRISSEAFMGGL